MGLETLKYYDENADLLNTKYNAIDFSKIQKSISIYLIGAKKVLEIGSGSGRDANYLTANGFDIIGLDGSEKMIENAIENYPKLRGKIIHAILPEGFPKFENKFDGFYSIGTLMHFNEEELTSTLSHIYNSLSPKSPVYVSVSNIRKSIDDRFFIAFDKEDWIRKFEDNNFVINEILENTDSSGRDIVWYSFLMETKG